MNRCTKSVPKRLLVFGASGHIGGPVARFVDRNSPEIKLRLATSTSGKLNQLKRQYPQADCVLADYLDKHPESVVRGKGKGS